MENWLPVRYKNWVLFLLGVLLVAALFLRLGYMELRGEEARRALVAMEMLASNSFWVPTLHGLPYINKPPFYQWILMFFFSGPMNISEYLLRLPGVLSALATGAMIYWVGRHWMSKEYAFLAGMIYLTGADLLFFGFVYAGEIDPFYALITFSQMAFLFLVITGKRPVQWVWLSFLLAAIGILTKGLPSVAHQFLSILTLVIMTKKWRLLIDPNMIGGAVLMFLLPALYFIVYAQWEDPIVYLVNLYLESVKKSGAISDPIEVVIHLFSFPFKFTWLLFPWSLFLIAIFMKRVRSNWWSNKQTGMVLIFLSVNLLIYWLSPDTRNRYLYPFLPWLTYLIVLVLTQIRKNYSLQIITVLLVLRVVYNLFVMPLQQQYFNGRESVEDILEVTGNDPVRYYGAWARQPYDLDLPFVGHISGEKKSPAQIPYKLPFYIMAHNGQIIQFDTVIQTNTWYVSLREDWLMDTSSIRLELPIAWRNSVVRRKSPVVLARKNVSQ